MAPSFSGNSTSSSSSSSSSSCPSISPPLPSSPFNSASSPCSSPSSDPVNIPSRLLFLIGLLLLFHCADADSAIFPGQNEWEEHRICGRLLINALKTVCNHQYAQPTRDQLYDNYYKSTGMLFRARRGSASAAALVGGGSTRRRRGIIFECCTNKCSLNYIRNNYCAQGPASDGPIPSWQFVEEASRKRRR